MSGTRTSHEVAAKILETHARNGGSVRATAKACGVHHTVVTRVVLEDRITPKTDPDKARRSVLASMRRGPLPINTIAGRLGMGVSEARRWLDAEAARGVLVVPDGDGFRLASSVVPPEFGEPSLTLLSDDDSTFTLGAMGDTHLGSKYSRLDVLDDLYDQYEREGVHHVFHAGNWIDGEATFNRHDLHVRGLDAQVSHLVDRYPSRNGIVTYAIAGDDHEGWYCQREGIDVGRYAQNAFRDAGRADWIDLGFMEAFVRLVNRGTGKHAMLHVIHPGGGPAYATSYTVQKIVESYGGGDKPAVLFAGHYHKLEKINIRNVWVVQTGCTQDQTPFMRKKRIEAHVGGHVVRLRQDPATGAIVEMDGMKRYFNTGYYNHRWSHSGDVVLPRKTMGGI